MMDFDRFEEYRQRLCERYTGAELVDLLDISIEEILEAFEPRWSGNKFLLTEVGMQEDDDAIHHTR